MLPEAALSLGADITRLYRKLSAAGTRLAALDLPLESDTGALCQLGLRLIQRAAEEAAPDAALAYSEPDLLVYRLPSPALGMHMMYSGTVWWQFRHVLSGYDTPPVYVEPGAALLQNGWGVIIKIYLLKPDMQWFQSHNLCDFAERITALVAMIRREEARLRARVQRQNA